MGLTDSAADTVWVCLKNGSENLYCIYRPAESSDRINKQLIQDLAKSKDLVSKGLFSGMLIVGDLNCGDIIWDESGQNILSTNSEKV